ncbi:uncharacterized protein LY79DRAFT_524672 [Colletotrichum navitas]|uniref:Zn(2)-C6 fungal-type domain-containing protein n=1 Tax=Colletotrichum navitas TaxID=681940 RepID=A0AAD8PQB2_9PEZI|nr:uncharacterized protein LY79DRAFT_524672 [Colletotrichum navitas]KAK1573966.1 hypothetical protein LY79DRAFT_524672 [Colletotrichum navitas]
MESRQRSPTPLLKTCRTCAHAKIKCDRTQDQNICDRCLRLGKECTYASARGRKPPGPRSSPSASESITSEQGQTPPEAASSSVTTGEQQPPRPSLPGYAAGSHDPFKAGQLSLDKGQDLLDRFRARLTPHFPFVIVADSEHVSSLRQTRPALCLALLAASSHDDVRLQRALGHMFNELVAARLVSGNFTCLDVLQGLLVHLAWPKNPRRWNVEGMSAPKDTVESLDERRTFLGTYYLSSCTSIVLQKLRIVTLSSFITETAERLAQIAEHPTDRYLPYIIRLQRLAEEIDDVVKNESVLDPMQIQASVSEAKESVSAFKNSLSFPLSDCLPTALLVPQMYTIQLCLNQLSLPEAPFGLSNPQHDSLQRLITPLSESTVSAKSLVSVLLHTPPGQEVCFPNIIWVMLHCGLTLAAWLDLLAARMGYMAEHLRQFSDIGHTIRQVVLRLESASSPNVDDRGDRDTFYHFSIRAKRVEKFYLQQQNQLADQQPTFLPQSPHVTMPPATAGFTMMGTPSSEFSINSQNLDYSLPPPMFAQPATPTDGNAYPNFIPPNPPAMSSTANFNMEALPFMHDSFIPFRYLGPLAENVDGAGLQF